MKCMSRFLALLLALVLTLPIQALAVNPKSLEAEPLTNTQEDSGRISPQSEAQELRHPSKQEIAEKWAEVTTATSLYVEEPSVSAPYATGSLSENFLESGITYLNYIRFVAGLPAVTLDDSLNENAQYGAVLLAAVDYLSHTPEQPSNMDDDFYNLGYAATTSSNISSRWGYAPLTCLQSSVQGCMDDSENNNLATVGHRRWLLNPTLGKVGFGYAQSRTGWSYIVTKVFDHSGDGCSFDFISWPVAGNQPTNLFNVENPWSISLNPAIYKYPSANNVEIVITRESDGKQWSFDSTTGSPSDHTQPYMIVNNQGFGVSNCIIFHPGSDNVSAYDGIFTVRVTGIYYTDGSAAELNYEVDFFDIDDVTDGHHYRAEVTEPTCTEGGYTTYTCTDCGESYVGSYVDPLGHDYDKVVTHPTCTEGGYTTHTCTRCGDSYVGDRTSAAGHSYVNGICTRCYDGLVRLSLWSNPTVTSYAIGDTVNLEGIVVAGYSENGDCIYLTAEDLKIVYCNLSCVGIATVHVGVGDLSVPFTVYVHARRIDMVLDASLYPESDHSYANSADDWQIVTYPGATTLTLTFSGETYTEYGYDYIRIYDGNDNLIATYTGSQAAGVSLTVPGDTAKINLTSDYSYTYYGYSFTGITANTVEHTGESAGYQAPTCTEPGFTDAFECEICGEHFGSRLIPALGHDYESVVTDPTCDQDGFTTRTCRRCGDVTKDDFVDAYGHNYDNGVTYTAPTDTADGIMSTTCDNCGQVASIILANDVHAPAGSPFSDWEWEVLQITNSLRCNAGLAPLAGFELLQDAAAIRAEEIDGYFSHTRPDGRSCFTALDDVGLGYYGAGENIASGYHSPAYVMYGWMNSLGHRENILTDWFNYLGVGYEYLTNHDWVQMFLSGDEYTSCELVLPETTTYEAGTLVDEMGIYLLLNSDYYGECYLPMQSMYCEGYDPNQVGKQTVTYSVLDFTGSFEITIASDDPCAGGHTSEVRNAEEATCTEPGYTGDTYCSVCGQLIGEGETIPAPGHNYGSWSQTTAPGCETYGEERRDCTNCDHYESRQIDPNGHSYHSAVTAPTCTEQGFTTYTCTVCGESHVDDYVDPIPHSYETVVTEPTCTEKGFTTYTCTVCGESHVDDYVDPIPHSYETVVTEPTCSEKGFTTYTCTVCGESHVDDYVDPIPHSYETVVTEPTCSEKGFTTYTCTVCGESHVDDYVDPIPHSYETVVTEPTCTEQGFTTYTCTMCGESYVDDYVDATGHIWDDENAAVKTCTVCGFQFEGFLISFQVEESVPVDSVWIDGVEYPVTRSGSSCSVVLSGTDASSLVVYLYNDPNAEDIHTQYPTGMRVWMLSFEENAYTARYIQEFDDLLQYYGTSIRITGKKGIRMISSLTRANKTALTGSGLAGYKLVEYGTALCFASDLDGGLPLTLGQPYVRSNFAYKRGEADPVFGYEGDLMHYTNVLVGFSLDQCKEDIAMRPYIILEDAEGNQITLYGGIVYRSIGYVAMQNRNVFKPGTASYDYVWEIIHHVYGDAYDADYKG